MIFTSSFKKTHSNIKFANLTFMRRKAKWALVSGACLLTLLSLQNSYNREANLVRMRLSGQSPMGSAFSPDQASMDTQGTSDKMPSFDETSYQIMPNYSWCSDIRPYDGKHPTILILVLTKYDDFAARQTIRKTWASSFPRNQTRTFFLLGQPPLSTPTTTDVNTHNETDNNMKGSKNKKNKNIKHHNKNKKKQRKSKPTKQKKKNTQHKKDSGTRKRETNLEVTNDDNKGSGSSVKTHHAAKVNSNPESTHSAFTSSRIENLNRIKKESHRFQDIILATFEDSYNNLGIKTLAVISWAARFCPTATFVLKIDADVMPFADNMMTFATRKAKRQANNTVMFCTKWHRAKANRKPSSKWYVPESQFPSSMYPDYCAGPSYLIAMPAAKAITAIASNYSFVRLEDTLVTGVVATDAGVFRSNYDKFMHYELDINFLRNCSRIDKTITTHLRDPARVKTYWQSYQKAKKQCAKAAGGQ